MTSSVSSSLFLRHTNNHVARRWCETSWDWCCRPWEPITRAVVVACPHNEETTFLLSQLSTVVVAVLRCAARTFNRPLPSPDNCPPKIRSLICAVSKHNFHHVCPPEKQPRQEVKKMVPHCVHNRPAFFTVPQCAHLNKQPKEGVEGGRGTDGKEGEEKQLGSRITWQTPSKTVVRRDTVKKRLKRPWFILSY